MNKIKRIAILGGGASALLLLKRFVDAGTPGISITIFEKGNSLGAGLPYSPHGANDEHITNVSANEIPELVTTVGQWLYTLTGEELAHYGLQAGLNEYRVLPRLLFGQYLFAQFNLLLKRAAEQGIACKVHFESCVIDAGYEGGQVQVTVNHGKEYVFDTVIMATGHHWPLSNEGKIPGYYDSPYPPAKLAFELNHAVGIKGSSLTAVDAITTLARSNGRFYDTGNGRCAYEPYRQQSGFKIIMHSRNGLLPVVRFHLEDSHLRNPSLLSKAEIEAHIEANDGFLSLDYIFDVDFKQVFRQKQPAFYAAIKDMSVEQFAEGMMQFREAWEPFSLLDAEYEEAEASIANHKSIYWKEVLGALSFAMNYPAKHFSAEDMLRLQKVLMPLISLVIAYMPQQSARELLALHEAGVLELVAVGEDGKLTPAREGATYTYSNEAGKPVTTNFKTFIDCTGQPHFSFDEFPFKKLVSQKMVSPAMLPFRSQTEAAAAAKYGNNNVLKARDGKYYLGVPGMAINDCFQAVNSKGVANEGIYMMAVPYIAGFNPDYSGLDFCEEASRIIVNSIIKR